MIESVRDVLISVYLGAGIVLTLALLIFAYVLFRTARGLVRSATRVVDDLEKVSGAAVDHIVTPLEEGVSFSSAVGNTFGFMTGFVAGLRGRRKRGKDGGEDEKRGRRKE